MEQAPTTSRVARMAKKAGVLALAVGALSLSSGCIVVSGTASTTNGVWVNVRPSAPQSKGGVVNVNRSITDISWTVATTGGYIAKVNSTNFWEFSAGNYTSHLNFNNYGIAPSQVCATVNGWDGVEATVHYSDGSSESVWAKPAGGAACTGKY